MQCERIASPNGENFQWTLPWALTLLKLNISWHNKGIKSVVCTQVRVTIHHNNKTRGGNQLCICLLVWMLTMNGLVQLQWYDDQICDFWTFFFEPGINQRVVLEGEVIPVSPANAGHWGPWVMKLLCAQSSEACGIFLFYYLFTSVRWVTLRTY